MEERKNVLEIATSIDRESKAKAREIIARKIGDYIKAIYAEIREEYGAKSPDGISDEATRERAYQAIDTANHLEKELLHVFKL